MGRYVGAKDLILNVIGRIGTYGATLKPLNSMETLLNTWMLGRMTICNMAIESGAKNGIMGPNQATLNYLKDRNVRSFEVVKSDDDYVSKKSTSLK